MRPGFVRWKTNTENHLVNNAHTVSHSGAIVMLWGSFSAVETGNLVQINRNVDSAKYRARNKEER